MLKPALRLAATLALTTASAAHAQTAIDLPGDRLHPESVATSDDGKTAYVTSMHGGVLRVTLADGKVEQWIVPGAYGSGSLFGVLADAKNNMLWTCTVDFAARGVKVDGADAGSWLKGFDLATGEGKVSLQLPGTGPVCNDMAVGSDGSVYVADTGQPRVLRWKPGATALEIWVEDAALGGGLDGLAFGSDGHLYINNVRTGALFRIELGAGAAPGKITSLTLSRSLSAPDGMRPLGGLDFVFAEGSGGRISHVTVEGDTAKVTTLSEGIAQPTAVAVAGDTVWYVQGLLSALFNPDAPRPPLPFKLTPVPLP